MPIIKSAIKRVRQAAKRRSHNLQVKRAIHRDVRLFEDALAAGDAGKTQAALQEAISEIDRAVKKGTLHRNTAARRKSQLTRAANPVILADGPPKKKAATKPKAKSATKKPAATKKPSVKSPKK